MRIPAADAAVADVDATGAARGGGAITMELFTKEHTLRTKSASKHLSWCFSLSQIEDYRVSI